MTRVLVVRGHQATPWELRPWELLPERFDVRYLLSSRNAFDVEGLALREVPVRTLRGRLPGGRLGDLAAQALGDRYLSPERAFADADVVHAEELSYWFAAQAASWKAKLGYRLVLTVWETIPLLATFRNRRARRNRELALEHADVFLAATERAREALLLEGVEADRIEVAYPGIDVERFSAAGAPRSVDEHVIVSPGRLVWEKGHQDVIRALAAIDRGLIAAPQDVRPKLVLVGSGPEADRLRTYAAELGLAGRVELRSVPYESMPALYASASCLVLASLPAAVGLYPGDARRLFWEEQFGMVLAEGMAAGLPIIASSSGAIPEVCGPSAEYFAPGDWLGLARLLASGPLSRPPATRVAHPADRVREYSTQAAAERLASVYDRLMNTPGRLPAT
jgi:glycosyltransferase involved in cell wall biosynthesis